MHVTLDSVQKGDASHREQCAPSKLSIQWKERVNQKGGTASVFKVMASSVHHEQIEVEPQLRVVKQYKNENRRLFEKERRAFSILDEKNKPHPNIIKYFGSFTHQDMSGALYHNLILENARCDLSEYFAKTAPPTTPGAISWFSKQLMGLADALRTVHEQDTRVGWHADVKPDNVLYADGNFKLADFGLSTFVGRKHSILNEEMMDGGTAMYSKSKLLVCFGTSEHANIYRRTGTITSSDAHHSEACGSIN
jgi:serine/threonine protein kinase